MKPRSRANARISSQLLCPLVAQSQQAKDDDDQQDEQDVMHRNSRLGHAAIPLLSRRRRLSGMWVTECRKLTTDPEGE
jgi:hypothetical protein